MSSSRKCANRSLKDVFKTRQVPAGQIQQRIAEAPHAQFVDRAMDIPVVQQREIPMQSMKTAVDIPLAVQHQVPMLQ